VLLRILTTLVFALPAFAGEYAVLASGQRMHLDHHELDAQTVRLFTSKDSFCEMAASSVLSYEQEDYVAPPEPPKIEAPALPAPKSAAPIIDPKTMLHDAAIRYGLPPKFVESVARVESSMRPDAVSPKGAIGVMQLMPATARALEADPNDPAQNIEAGTRLLRELLIKYNNDAVKALAAYNAGEGAVDRYNGIPPYAETQSYVDKVIRKYQKAER
jgi:soluble lytic murein transglycosylase-like protein